MQRLLVSVWLAFGFTILSPLPRHAGAQSASSAHPVRPPTARQPYQVSTTSQGVKLKLSVPRQSYPQNALIRTTVTVRNVTAHDVIVPGLCTIENPQVQVLTDAGDQVYPPVSPQIFPILLCPPTLPGQPIPGVRIYAILRADRVRAQVVLPHRNGDGTFSYTAVVVTPSITVPIAGTTTPPTFTFKIQPAGPQSPTQPYVLVHPMGPVHGPLLYQYSGKCANPIPGPPPTGVALPTSLTWMVAKGNRIDAPCTFDLAEWHLAAAWVGQPVAEFDYVRPGWTGIPTSRKPRSGHL
jgi:hypothetical protein